MKRAWLLVALLLPVGAWLSWPLPTDPRWDLRAEGFFTIGDVAVYHDRLDLDVPLVRSNTDATEVVLTARYQGCADRGICYPPQKTEFKLALPAATGAVTVAALAPASTATTPPAVKQSEQDEIAAMIAGRSTWGWRSPHACSR